MRLGRGSSGPAASGANLKQAKRLFAACDLAESGWSPPLLCPRHLRSTPEPACPRGSPQAPPPGALASHVGPAGANAREDLGKQRVRIRGGVGFCSTPSVHFSHSARALSPSPTDPGARPGGHAPPSSRSWGQRRPPACRPRPTIVCWTPDPSRRSLGALAHLAPLALQAAGPLLLPLPPELGPRLLVRVRLVRHAGRSPATEKAEELSAVGRFVKGGARCFWCVRVLGDGSGQDESSLASGTWFYSAVEGREGEHTERWTEESPQLGCASRHLKQAFH